MWYPEWDFVTDKGQIAVKGCPKKKLGKFEYSTDFS